MVIQKTSHQTLYAVLTLVFTIGTLATIDMCKSMSTMGQDMRMPGGWTMSMVWMLMPDQTWLEAAASFVIMWTVMMVPMMLPSLAPMLARYRDVIGWAVGSRVGLLTTIVGLGYFVVWTLIGVVVFLFGFAVSAIEMRHADVSRAVPIMVGMVVVIVGALQFTRGKPDA